VGRVGGHRAEQVVTLDVPQDPVVRHHGRVVPLHYYLYVGDLLLLPIGVVEARLHEHQPEEAVTCGDEVMDQLRRAAEGRGRHAGTVVDPVLDDLLEIVRPQRADVQLLRVLFLGPHYLGL